MQNYRSSEDRPEGNSLKASMMRRNMKNAAMYQGGVHGYINAESGDRLPYINYDSHA